MIYNINLIDQGYYFNLLTSLKNIITSAHTLTILMCMFDTFCPDERSASLRALMQTATVLVPGEIKAIESVSDS